MKTHPTEFDVRENTASRRQHDLRFATDVHSNLVRTEQQALNTRVSPPNNGFPTADSDNHLHAAPHRAATGGVERQDNLLLTVREVADLLRVPLSWVYGRTRRRGEGQLPHLKLGKYLRFEERIVKEFIREQRRA
jgi:excisionase family DNA binding protein